MDQLLRAVQIDGIETNLSIASRVLGKWARKRYKRYKTNLNKAYYWLKRIKEQFPNLFYQWKLGFS